MENVAKICRETLRFFEIEQKYQALYAKGSFIHVVLTAVRNIL
jgi:hypothetical protein